MTEKYLHYLWGSKQFPIVDTRLTTGDSIVVKNVGEYNENLKGPDFMMGAVKFGNILEYGPIEIHIKGSDWYAHNHHLDRNYDNVILHVVYDNDKPVVQNGRTIPTIELEDFVDNRENEKSKVQNFFSLDFPCSNYLKDVDDYFLIRTMDLAFIQKMHAKRKQLSELSSESEVELLYNLCALSFGMKINQLLQVEMLRELPYDLMHNLKENGVLTQFANSLLGKLKYSPNWNKKGSRPSSFPEKRMKQFVSFLLEFNLEELKKKILIDTSENILSEFEKKCRMIGLPKSLVNHISINAFAPFLWIQSEALLDDSLQVKAIDLLSLLPAEKNGEVTRLSTIFGNVNNAYHSQGLMALNRYFCSRKKCLSCDVGNKVLNRL